MDIIAECLGKIDESKVAYDQIVQDLNSTGVDWVLTGGLALAFHGYARFTKDVDILVDKDQVHKLIENDNFEVTEDEPDFIFLIHRPTGVHVDVLKGGTFFPPMSSIVKKTDSVGTPVVSLEDLILLKMARGDPADQGDIYRLLQPLAPDFKKVDFDKLKRGLSSKAYKKIEGILGWTQKKPEAMGFKSWLKNLFHK